MASLRKVLGQDQRTANQIMVGEIISLIHNTDPNTITVETVEQFLKYLKTTYKIQVRFI